MGYDFVNPYSFFPLGEKKAVAEKRETPLYSGVIRYSIQTKTPLLIPETEKRFIELVRKDDEIKEHEHCVFASRRKVAGLKGEVAELENEQVRHPASPYIPASEMRGLIRSVYETLTDSCLSTLNDDDILSKRTREVFSAGLLKKTDGNTFELYEAKDCLLRLKDPRSEIPEDDDWAPNDLHYRIKSHTTRKLAEGEKRTFFIRYREKGKPLAFLRQRDGAVAREGWIIKGLDGPQIENDGVLNLKAIKHNCHVFILEKNKVGIADTDVLEAVFRMYEENGVNVYSEYAHAFSAFKKGEAGAYFPVYYSHIKEIGKTYLSPASITREIYTRRIKHAVRDFTPCDNTHSICPACALFGALNTERSISSRLRFTDLRFTGSAKSGAPDYAGAATLIPMSAPKIANMEFYLERPAENAVFWTYDYYIDDRQRIHVNNAPINGRKFYWNFAGEILTTEEKSDQNKTVYPLAEGNTFAGEVYFDGISRAELENLFYVLNCGESQDTPLKNRTHCYKLGAAKPAGLGSVAMQVNRVLFRTFDPEARAYTVAPWTSAGENSLRHLDRFEIMTGFLKKNADYPRIAEDGKVYEWFTWNHAAFRFNKKTQRNEITNSPNKRTSEFFRAYMIPLQPELGRIPMPGTQPGPARNGEAGGRDAGPSESAGTEKTPLCICCRERTVEINRNTQKPFPLCSVCNADKVTVRCSVCGKSFSTPEFFSRRNPVCFDCRKNK